MAVGRSAPRYQAMTLLYPRSKKLQSYLSEYFLVVVRICHHLLKLLQRSMFERLVSPMTESDIVKYQSESDMWANAIKEEVYLLMAQDQSRQLKSFNKYSELESHRKKVEIRLRILDSCSTYDYQKTWKEIRKCGNTSWFTLQREYQNWKVGSESCTLLYFGKLGSGKSVTLANMVDDLNLHRQSNPQVAYFFCRHDDPESLRARTILGSLAKQLLRGVKDITAMSKDCAMKDPLTLDSDRIHRLLKRNLEPNYRAYFILDGLDECHEDQKEDMIRYLQEIQEVFPLLVCLSFRQEAGNALTLRPESFAKSSVISIPDNNPDIAEFIQTELERRVELGRLKVGEPTLILDIRDALVERAQGMFLWVVLQINSLCLANTDESIRHALANLPRDLTGTFSRVLEQSAALGKENQRRILELITVAYRPLTTEQLREALSVVPGDTHWNWARMPNDIYAALACCGSLVIVDEETLSVKFIHHSVKQFLLSGSRKVAGQTFTIQNAHRTMASIIMTYLNYSIFDTQISRMTIPRVRHEKVPIKVIDSVLDSSSTQRLALKLLRSRKSSNFDIGKVLAMEGQSYWMQPTNQCVFLNYARLYWAQHILRGPSQDPAIYKSLCRPLDRNILVLDAKDDFDWTPLFWAASRGHEAVARLLLEKGVNIEMKDTNNKTPVLQAAKGGHEAIVLLLLEKGANIKSMDELLLWAARGGHEGVMRLLLAKGADIKSKDTTNRTPLLSAASSGQEAMVQLLLENGADIESKDIYNQTALIRAACRGHAEVVQLLLEKGADIESKDNNSQTALSLASMKGYEALVRMLVEKGADIESKDDIDRTPLMWAVSKENESMVRLLLEKGADIQSRDKYGKTALMQAADGKHEAIVRLLELYST